MRYFVILSFVFLIACSEEKQYFHPGEYQNKKAADFGKELAAGLNIDSNYILDPDTSRKMNYKEVRELQRQLLPHPISDDLSYILGSTCLIDSLKAIGKYKEYLKKIDIAMTEEAIAYKIGKLRLSDSSMLLVWGVTLTSYDACPFFWGTYILGSYSNETWGYTSFPLGKIYSAADPPNGMSRMLTARLQGDSVTIHSIERSDADMDAAGEAREIYDVVLQLKKGNISIIRNDKIIYEDNSGSK